VSKSSRFLIHPFLFAIYPILHLYADNADLAPAAVALRAMALSLMGAAVLLWALRSLLPSAPTRALVVSLFYVAFFNYTYLYLGMRSLPVLGSAYGRALFAPVYAGLWAMALWYVWRRRAASWQTLTLYLNLVSMALLAFGLVRVGAMLALDRRPQWQPVADRLIRANLAYRLRLPQRPPDIYYIIVDGYARADVLEEFYGYDNSDFLDFLAARGFYVPQYSYSNYPQTYLSLASSLNMSYLDDIGAAMGESSHDRRPLRYLIDHNSVAQLLRRAGYRFVFLASAYSATRGNPQADVCYCQTYGLSEFENVLLTPTPFWLWSPQSFQHEAHRRQIDSALRQLGDLPDLPEPMFVFVHIMAPHPPFVFGPRGEALDQRAPFTLSDGGDYPGDATEYIERYRGQVIYLNGRLQEVVDAILARSDTPPVIILQGDHGPRSLEDSESSLRERLGILAAYHLPGGGPRPFYDAITPVNTFRLLFNRYFGARFPVLKDESYFSAWSHPYRLVQVAPDYLGQRMATRAAR
jgi:hypothetical protein